MWSLASIRNWQELSLPGSPPNGCEPWTSGVVYPTNAPCIDRLRHWFDLCWTWKENNMVNAGTDRCTIDACRWTKGSPRCCNEHNWDDCHTSLWQNQHLHQGARRNLFPRNNSVQQIPPTRAALEEHVKRAVYQDGHLCGETLLLDPVLPSPTDWRVCVRACVRAWVRVCVWRQKEYMSPTGLHCHKHQNHVTSWSLVAARVVAESAACARRMHFSAQASASVCQLTLRSLIYSYIKEPCHDPWELVTRSRYVHGMIQIVFNNNIRILN